MAHQIISESSLGSKTIDAIRKYQTKGHLLLSSHKDDKLLAYLHLANGIAAIRSGQWSESNLHLEKSIDIFTQNCIGVSYELHQAHLHHLHVNFVLGNFHKIGSTLPHLIQDSEERGDLLAEVNLKTSFAMNYYFAIDRPDLAGMHAKRALDIWPHSEFQFQHWQAFILYATIDQYLDRPLAAWNEMHKQWPALEKSKLLDVQLVRITCMEHRARTALVYAFSPHANSKEKREALRMADAAIRTIKKEKVTFGIYFKLLAMRAKLSEDHEGATHWLLKAENYYSDHDMLLHQHVMMWCRGVHLGKAGNTSKNRADQWLKNNGIQKPNLYIRVHIQGFDEGR